MSRRGREGELDVEELNLGAWGGPGAGWTRSSLDEPPTSAGPPGPPEHVVTTTRGRGPDAGDPHPVGSWWRRHMNHVIAGAGGFALLIAVVAVASGGSDPSATPTTPPTTVAPSTTAGRPVETAAPSTTTAPGAVLGGTATGADEPDYRFVVGEPPEGFAAMGVDEIDAEEVPLSSGSPLLFAADGWTWETGPWLLVSSGSDYGPGLVFPFTRPPLAFAMGDLPVETGAGPDGVEVTTFAIGGRQIGVTARGLDGLATAVVAAQLAVSPNGISVPDAAVPAGLRARPDIDVAPWEEQWVPGTRTSVSYGLASGMGWMTVNVRPRGLAPDISAAAPYLLRDLRYLVIGSATGVAGTHRAYFGDDVHYVVWQLADREYVASGTGMSLDELVVSATSVIQPGDPGWRQARWDELRSAVREYCDDIGTPIDLEPPASVATASVDDRWQVDVRTGGSAAAWSGQTSGGQDFLYVETPIGAPLLRVGTRDRWPGMPEQFPATAVALVDRSMTGAVLRLTTTGTRPQTMEVPLQPLDHDGLAPYLAGAVVLPWIDGGFVAQLITRDGQTIAVQTDADLA